MGGEGSRPSQTRQVQVSGEHHCVGCGKLNPNGLKLTFFEDPTSGLLWTDWTPGREQEGFTGIAHGGMISTVLDEVMGWVLSSRRIWAVTGRLNVRFRNPVEIGVPTRTTGWIERDAGRLLDVQAVMRNAESESILAEAEGAFFRVPEERAAEWEERYLQ